MVSLIYKEYAKYYDLIYSEKDYKKETNKIKQLISKYKKSNGKELLDVACGTGKHLKYLKSSFSCTGVDINKQMMDIAKKNVKGVTFKKANMITLNLNKKFDIITCLFSSIGYIKTYNNLRKTITNFYRHLRKGGVVIIHPWLTKSTFKVGLPWLDTYNKKHIKIARLSIPKIKDNLSIIDFHYLVAEKNKDVKYFKGRHELGFFDIDKTLKIMRESGFKVKFLKKGFDTNDTKCRNIKGRGIYIGIKN